MSDDERMPSLVSSSASGAEAEEVDEPAEVVDEPRALRALSRAGAAEDEPDGGMGAAVGRGAILGADVDHGGARRRRQRLSLLLHRAASESSSARASSIRGLPSPLLTVAPLKLA